jgi:2-polyprenyl-3-methyl-5-hydroxy-6-metoxy-1,4-benzoquinol methylase
VVLITEQYRLLNKQLHAASGSFGASGILRADAVGDLLRRIGGGTVLDYGCGKGSLGRALGVPIAEYDPAVPEHSAKPVAADLVVCSDVLEHIEPDCLDEVLDDLQRLTLKLGYFVISTRLAKKHLPDGRNAHLIVQSGDWWMHKLEQRWDVQKKSDDGRELIVEVAPK